MATTTKNLELTLLSGTDNFDTDTIMENFTKIDTAVGEADSSIGEKDSLTTTAKDNLVAAINEVDGNIGDLSGLTTTAKTNLVAALNEVNQNMNGVFSVSSSGLVDGTQNVEFPWSSYLLLSFSVNNYSNYGQSSVILSSVFNGMSENRRVILMYNDMSIEIYPNGNNSITIRASGDIDNNIVVKITGIINL